MLQSAYLSIEIKTTFFIQNLVHTLHKCMKKRLGRGSMRGLVEFLVRVSGKVLERFGRGLGEVQERFIQERFIQERFGRSSDRFRRVSGEVQERFERSSGENREKFGRGSREVWERFTQEVHGESLGR